MKEPKGHKSLLVKTKGIAKAFPVVWFGRWSRRLRQVTTASAGRYGYRNCYR